MHQVGDKKSYTMMLGQPFIKIYVSPLPSSQELFNWSPISWNSSKLAKTGHGPHFSTLVCTFLVRLLFVLLYVLFVCKCVLPPGDNTIAVNKYIISYQIRALAHCSIERNAARPRLGLSSGLLPSVPPNTFIVCFSYRIRAFRLFTLNAIRLFCCKVPSIRVHCS
jgi:hypothetical protein